MLTLGKPRFETGFTIVELCIVIAIAGVLFAIGMPSYRTWIENSKLRNAAESISSGLMLARSEAVTRNASVNLTLAAGTSASWTIGCTTVTATCPALLHDHNASEGSSSSVTVASASGRTITFNNVGRLSAPAPTAPATLIAINIDNNALSGSASRDLRVTVSLGGGVRMCDPKTTAPDARAC